MLVFKEILKIKYLLLFEIFVLIIFFKFGLKPSLLAFSIVPLIILFKLTFDNLLFGIHIVTFSIILDALFPLKNYSSGPSVLIAEGVFLFFTIIIFLKISSSKSFDLNSSRIVEQWLLFLAWSLIIGLLVAVNQFRIITYWKNYFAGFLVFMVILNNIKTKDDIKLFIISILIWSLSLSLIELKILYDLGGLTQGLFGLFMKKNLLSVGWGKSNYLAAFYVLIIPIAIGSFYYFKSKKWKILLIPLIMLMIFGIMITLSRGGIIALFISVFILFTRILKRKTILSFLVIVIIISLVIFLNPLTNILFTRISSFETTGSYFSRINFYMEVWAAFLKNPLTGVGIGNLSYYSTFIIPAHGAPSAHNIILGSLGEIGLIGSIFYFLIFSLLIIENIKNYRAETNESIKILQWSFFSAIIGALLHSMVEPIFEGFQFSIMFWIVAGLSLQLDKIKVSYTQP